MYFVLCTLAESSSSNMNYEIPCSADRVWLYNDERSRTEADRGAFSMTVMVPTHDIANDEWCVFSSILTCR